MTTPKDRAALVEMLSLDWCRRHGVDPDDSQPEEIREGRGPWPFWKLPAMEMRAILDALDAAGVALGPKEATADMARSGVWARDHQARQNPLADVTVAQKAAYAAMIAASPYRKEPANG